MASSSINIQSPADGVSMIAIRGAMHHLLGLLAPPQGSPHQFAQLYIIDNADAQAAARFVALGQGNVDLDRRTLQELQQMLLGSNVYVQRFVQAMDLPPQDLANYEIVIRVDGNVVCRRYNAVATLTWPSVGVKPNTWKSWGFGVLRDSRMFRARRQDPKHLALGCSWCHLKGLEA